MRWVGGGAASETRFTPATAVGSQCHPGAWDRDVPSQSYPGQGATHPHGCSCFRGTRANTPAQSGCWQEEPAIEATASGGVDRVVGGGVRGGSYRQDTDLHGTPSPGSPAWLGFGPGLILCFSEPLVCRERAGGTGRGGGSGGVGRDRDSGRRRALAGVLNSVTHGTGGDRCGTRRVCKCEFVEGCARFAVNAMPVDGPVMWPAGCLCVSEPCTYRVRVEASAPDGASATGLVLSKARVSLILQEMLRGPEKSPAREPVTRGARPALGSTLPVPP